MPIESLRNVSAGFFDFAFLHMTVAEADLMISRAIDAGRPSYSYLIEGDIKGNCTELVKRILLKLFPSEQVQIESNRHPDVVFLNPEGKKRVITVDSMREKIVDTMSVTAYSGGWKVGIINGADRLTPQAANAFLKILEEPTPKTMFLLLTERPEALLPTIVSRTQRVSLPLPLGVFDGDDYEEIADAFVAKDAARLAEKLKQLKAEVADEEVAFVQQSFYKTLLSFTRSMMLSDTFPKYLAFRNVEAVEEAYRQAGRSINDDAVLSFMLDRITWPKGDVK